LLIIGILKFVAQDLDESSYIFLVSFIVDLPKHIAYHLPIILEILISFIQDIVVFIIPDIYCYQPKGGGLGMIFQIN
jgi:hypothetical protein